MNAKVEQLKKEGNLYFQKKCWREAIESYSKAIGKLQHVTPSSASLSSSKSVKNVCNEGEKMMKATLLSNRSLCYFQLYESKVKEVLEQKLDFKEGETMEKQQLLQDIIEDTSLSLDLLQSIIGSEKGNDTDTTSSSASDIVNIRSLRSKLLYRRAKANSSIVIMVASGTSIAGSASSGSQLQVQNKVSALQDLHDLLSFDPKNKLAKSLLISIQKQQQKEGEGGSGGSTLSSSPIRRALSIICQNYHDYHQNVIAKTNVNDLDFQMENRKNMTQSLHFVYSSLLDDFISTSEEIISYQTRLPSETAPSMSGLEVLYFLAFHHREEQNDESSTIVNFDLEYQTLSMQILNEACMYLPAMKNLHEYHFKKQLEIEQLRVKEGNTETFILSTIISQNMKEWDNSYINTEKIEKYIQLSLTYYIRYVLYVHIKDDNSMYDSIKDSKEAQPPVVRTSSQNATTLIVQYLIQIVLKLFSASHEYSTNSCYTTTRSLLHAIIEATPQLVLEQINSNTNNQYTTSQKKKLLYYYPIQYKLSTQNMQSMKPREVALYRKKQFMTTNHQKQRSRQNAIYFCEQGGLTALLHNGIDIDGDDENTTHDKNLDCAYWRKEIMITIGKVIHCFFLVNQHHQQKQDSQDSTTSTKKEEGGDNEFKLNDEELKRLVIQKFFHRHNANSSLRHKLTIEVIHEDDEDDENADKEKSCNNDQKKKKENILIRCLLSTSMLLVNGELGAWVLRSAWSNSQGEWISLIISSDNDENNDENTSHTSMSIAAELASAAAGVEQARSWIVSCTSGSDDTIWKRLLSCDDQDVRSGAASAMAKLGLADKAISSDEGELFSLLEIAGGLIAGDENDSTINLPNKSNSLTQLERGVELVSYLSSKTIIKDEIAHGFSVKTPSKVKGASSSSSREKSLLENLIDLAASDDNTPDGKVISSSVCYALSTIFSSLAVSIETLRKEAFADKEITAEQYDQLQSMGKTDEEKELENSKTNDDDPEAVQSRIRKMAENGVCRALVNLLRKSTTEATKEQVVICMMRFATEPSVRGKMIQAGCLSECIQTSKVNKQNGSLSDKEQRTIRHAQHAIGKMLVTTNPVLLTASQRMGSVKPLIQLVKDNEATDLQTFESLLSLTNLAGYDDETKQRIVSEKGISVLGYAMFSDHEMVRRAATEAMSNLVPHPDMIEYLRKPEKLKVWVAFASDFDENYECARAALGCLAMVTGDAVITQELCKLSNTKAMVESVLSSGKLELMHRILVTALNIAEYESEWITTSGTLAFCEAYIFTYHDGKESDKLQFSASDNQLMAVTVDIAKELVKACSNR